jgi:phosphoglycerate dehydrogenase-like enzyme
MALPSTPETLDIIGETEIRLMKSSAVLINIGRGSTLDEAALSTALHEGRLEGAALDVFKVEPLPDEHFLWRTPRVLVSCHSCVLTEDYLSLLVEVFFKNLEKFLAGQPLLTPVDRQAGY